MKQIFSTLFLLASLAGLFAQTEGISINANGNAPHSSAILDVQSNQKGLLIPRMNSASRQAINNPARGLMVYDNTTNSFWYYNGNAWNQVRGQSGTIQGTNGNSLNIRAKDAGSFLPGNARGENSVDFQTSRGNGLEVASGLYSVISGGSRNIASNSYTAIGGGLENQATEFFSFVGGGRRNRAEGRASAVLGGAINVTIGEASSILGGKDLRAESYVETVVGSYNVRSGGSVDTWVGTDPIFVIGNGQYSTGTQSNAMTVLKNGRVGIGVIDPQSKLHLSGKFRYQDGSQANGRVLTSSSDGTATWKAPAKDNLGTHIATKNITLGTNYLSGDGDNEGIYLKANGYAGIGTSTPQNMLDVSGGLALGATYAGTEAAPSNGLLVEGTVGIGTPTPKNTLDVSGGMAVGASYAGVQTAPTGSVIIAGRLGLGTSNPTRAKLEINGSVDNNLPTIGYLNATGATGSYNPSTFPYSIYASNVIAGQEFQAHSDQRIKQIEGISDSEADLVTLMQIEVTDYRLRDSLAKGNRPIKKVIAQQVAKVYPEAVTTNLTEVVPDIYRRAQLQDGWIMLATDLKVGERVKLITEEGAKVYGVSKVEDDRFQVSGLLVSPLASAPSLGSGQVFVYGREVDDFHTVDYEAISMLNVSATQAQQRIIELQQEKIETLEARLEQMENLEASLRLLEAKFSSNDLDRPAVSPN